MHAGRAEHALWEALRIIQEQFLGWTPAEPHGSDWLPDEAYEDHGDGSDG